MRPVDPPEYFVVRECDLPGMREIYAPGGRHRYAFARERLDEVAFYFVPSHQWRPGLYRSPMRGWRTRARAEAYIARCWSPCPTRVYIVQWLEVDVGSEVEDRLVECGVADTEGA